MAIPFRTRRVLKRTALVLLIVALVGLLVFLFWSFWLGRFQVFTRDGGVRFDFDRSAADLSGEPAVPPDNGETVSIYYNEGENAISTSKEMTQIVGYYITAKDLYNGIDGVLTKIRSLPTGTPVMVDVKNVYGSFFYSSKINDRWDSDIDPEKMDQLITHLRTANMYAIARMPAMPDYYYGLHHVGHGLHHSSGMYLWSDSRGCYWLNPASEGTMAYWIQIIMELKDLGFDEVVLDEYHFPENASLLFSGDRAQTLAGTAQTLVDTCATDNFAVSFVQTSPFTAPTGRSRQYLTGVEASEAASVAEAAGTVDPSVYVVFLTDVHDTRFDEYSVLRPLSAIF